ncbi:MAG: hypothetical protein WC047_05560 [Kiritimatiellales bacterium]
MAENQQQNIDQQKGPFSPLQSGCAFVMLTNMLLYLAIVAFTFNLLDPSKIDASYLAKRGFTALPEPKSEQDAAFQQLSQAKREQQQQIQAEQTDTSKLGPKQEPSSAARLSQIEQRRFESSRPNVPENPKAALTESSLRTGSTSTRSAQSRLYSSIAIFPQTTLPQTYSPVRLYAPKPVSLETYETIPVEMASGIDFPTFSLPVSDPAGAYLYRPPNPIPEASRGGFKLSSPPTGAESLYTNEIQKTTPPADGNPDKQPPLKDQL